MGKRLRPYTLKKPKCLVEINGQSLIDYQINILKSRGINEIIIVGGYKSEMLKDKANRLYVNKNFENTNMVWSLFAAQNELNGDVIISYGDIVYSPKILESLIKSESNFLVAVDKSWKNYWKSRFQNPLLDAESMSFDRKGNIIELGSRVEKINDIKGQYIGLIKLNSDGLKILKKTFKCLNNAKSAYMTDLIQSVIDSGYTVSSLQFNDPWIEIDTTRDLNLKETKSRLKKIISFL